MNRISNEKLDAATELLVEGASIREVHQKINIARETAHRLSKIVKLVQLDGTGQTRVNTGKNKNGFITFYHTAEKRTHWGIL